MVEVCLISYFCMYQELYFAGYIYSCMVFYRASSVDRAQGLIFQFHSEGYPVRVYTYCLVNSIVPLIYKTGLQHPLFKRIHDRLRA